MFPPETHYARSGDVFIAYQVLGHGLLDMVCVPGFVSHVEHWWEAPSISRFMQRLASFSRLILFDKRGSGLSDRMAGIATLEERMDDVRAVMDAVGSEQAAVFGISEGGPMSILFAATYPEDRHTARGGNRPCPANRIVHRYRRFDGTGGGVRRPSMARSAGQPSDGDAARVGTLSGSRGRHDRRRLLGHLRRPGPGDSMRHWG